jgi:putative copper export protein
MLNEGRFYRNIASGKAVFSTGQRASLLVIVASFVVLNVVAFASTLAVPLSEDPTSARAWNLGPSMILLVWLIFWIFLTVKALFPPLPPVRKPRRGYRSSGRS